MLLSMELLDLSLVEPNGIRPISRAEYERMVEVVILDEDDKCELLRGVIVAVSPQGWLHAQVIVWLNAKLVRALDPRYSVRPQLPYVADDWSEPEPDLCVVIEDQSRREHPASALLVIEVAVSSLRIDRTAKQIIYAENGVPEYWVIDAERRQVHVYTTPARGGYASHVVLGDGDELRPAQLPGVAIAIAEMPR